MPISNKKILRNITNNSNQLTQITQDKDEIRSLLTANGLPDTEKDTERVLKFRGSTDHLDRYETVFSLRGWDLKNYRENPVFLYQHNRDCMADSVSMPVGRSIKEFTILPEYKSDQLTVEKEFTTSKGDKVLRTVPNVLAHTRKTPRDEKNDPTGLFQLVYFPDEKNSEAVFKAFNLGLLNTVSIGAAVNEKIDPSEVSDEERNAIGFKEALYTQQELFELSAVTLPGNPKAVKMALDQGYNKEFLDILGIDTAAERFGNIRGVIRLLEEQGPDLIEEVRKIKKINRKLKELKNNQSFWLERINNIELKIDQLLAVNSLNKQEETKQKNNQSTKNNIGSDTTNSVVNKLRDLIGKL